MMDNDLPTPNDDFRPPPNFALMAASFEGGIAVVALGLGWLLGSDPLESFPRTWHGVAWGIGWGTAATLPLLILLWISLKCPLRPLVELTDVIDKMLTPLFRHCGLIEVAVISALAGLGEELLFRGVIQEVVADWVGGRLGPWVAIAVAAVLFGLAHRITTTYAVLAGLIGLYLGWIWIVAGKNILVPITAHALYDLIALVYLLWIRKPSGALNE